MPASDTDTLPIRSGDDVVRIRQLVRTRAQEIRLSLVDQTKLVTAASELARNTLVHGGSGTARIEVVERMGRRGIKAVFADSGPGIPDLDLAMTPGWTSGRGLGLATPGNLLLFTFLMGVGAALTAPVWQSIVPQLVPRKISAPQWPQTVSALISAGPSVRR